MSPEPRYDWYRERKREQEEAELRRQARELEAAVPEVLTEQEASARKAALAANVPVSPEDRLPLTDYVKPGIRRWIVRRRLKRQGRRG